jgi:hypothetical protein
MKKTVFLVAFLFVLSFLCSLLSSTLPFPPQTSHIVLAQTNPPPLPEGDSALERAENLVRVTRSLQRDLNGNGRVDPGDTIRFNLRPSGELPTNPGLEITEIVSPFDLVKEIRIDSGEDLIDKNNIDSREDLEDLIDENNFITIDLSGKQNVDKSIIPAGRNVDVELNSIEELGDDQSVFNLLTGNQQTIQITINNSNDSTDFTLSRPLYLPNISTASSRELDNDANGNGQVDPGDVVTLSGAENSASLIMRT